MSASGDDLSQSGTAASDLEDESNTEDEEGFSPKSSTDVALTIEDIRGGISTLAKVGRGLELAYIRLEVNNRALSNIDILETYYFLQIVDLSDNKLTSLESLQFMELLTVLNVANNRLTSIQLHETINLKYLNMSGNRIDSTTGLRQPSLEFLNLSANKVNDLSGLSNDKLPQLRLLDLSDNAIKSLQGLTIESLESLYVARNRLKSLEGIHMLPGLKKLHLRENPIEVLDGCGDIERSHLEYLNIRGTAIENPLEFTKMKGFTNLKAIVVADTPLANDSETYRLDLLMNLTSVRRIDKDPVLSEELIDARIMLEQREAEKESGNIDAELNEKEEEE